MIYDNLLVNAIVVLTPDGKQRNSIRKYLHHPFTIMIVCKTAIEINKLNPTNIKHILKNFLPYWCQCAQFLKIKLVFWSEYPIRFLSSYWVLDNNRDSLPFPFSDHLHFPGIDTLNSIQVLVLFFQKLSHSINSSYFSKPRIWHLIIKL